MFGYMNSFYCNCDECGYCIYKKSEGYNVEIDYFLNIYKALESESSYTSDGKLFISTFCNEGLVRFLYSMKKIKLIDKGTYVIIDGDKLYYDSLKFLLRSMLNEEIVNFI